MIAGGRCPQMWYEEVTHNHTYLYQTKFRSPILHRTIRKLYDRTPFLRLQYLLLYHDKVSYAILKPPRVTSQPKIIQRCRLQLGPLLLTRINSAWIRNYIHYKVCDEITYPFPNFKGCAIEVREEILNIFHASKSGPWRQKLKAVWCVEYESIDLYFGVHSSWNQSQINHPSLLPISENHEVVTSRHVM